MTVTDVRVIFPSPVTLRLSAPGAAEQPATATYDELPLHVQADVAARTLRAYLPPISTPLELYAPADFAAACADSIEDHAARVLRLLGSDPAATLQALLDGAELLPTPPRVPREIPNWRAKVILANMGRLAEVDACIAALPGDQSTTLALAWHGNAALARSSATVAAMADQLGLSDSQLDAFFIAAAAISI